MTHIDDSELMEYAAGRVAAPRKEQVAEHIAACPECSERRRQAALLWDSLGQWTVETTGHEVAGRITAVAEKAERERNDGRWTKRVRFLPAVLRVAASIIIAVAVGHRLGRSSVTGKMETAAASKDRPEYLSAFGLEWSSELAWLILEDDSSSAGPPPGGEGR